MKTMVAVYLFAPASSRGHHKTPRDMSEVSACSDTSGLFKDQFDDADT